MIFTGKSGFSECESPLYNETFPMISDEEFITRCKSAVSLETVRGVRKTLSDAFGVEAEPIYPETNLIELYKLW